MKNFETVVAIEVEQGLSILSESGREAFVNLFMKAARKKIDFEQIKTNFDKFAIFDVEQGLKVLKEAGQEAFIVFFLMESSRSDKRLTVPKIAQYTGMTLEEAKEACYRLGLHMMGIGAGL